MITPSSPLLPLPIPTLQSSLASLEYLIFAHWKDFLETFDIRDRQGTEHVILSFTLTGIVVEWISDGSFNGARVTPWEDFTPWYVSHTTAYASQTSQDAPGQ